MSAYKVVYSTGKDSRCDGCGRPVASCACRSKAQARPPADGIARIRLEKKGRGGKAVTTIAGLALAEPALRALATELKKLCGTGGSVKDGVIEIQGDHRQRVLADLARRGHTSKLAGG